MRRARCAVTEWWAESPFLALASFACFMLIVLAHVVWLPMASLRCHCNHMDYMNHEEHEALAKFCIAYYAQYCDRQSFKNVADKCLHDRTFLREWAQTHDPIDDFRDESAPDSFYDNSIKGVEGATMYIHNLEIPIRQELPCRLYTTLLCWAHYWFVLPMIALLVFGAVILGLHVEMYGNYRALENQHLVKER